jgi:hypothetical protein
MIAPTTQQDSLDHSSPQKREAAPKQTASLAHFDPNNEHAKKLPFETDSRLQGGIEGMERETIRPSHYYSVLTKQKKDKKQNGTYRSISWENSL